jgi:putative phosphonate metabolism protein
MSRKTEAVAPYRVAIYYAPEVHSQWWIAGSEWLGRCACTNQPRNQPMIASLTQERFACLTAEPRRYGWHATLKAPFRLAPGHDLDSLRTAVRQLCKGRQPFDLAPLNVTRMGSFLALRPLWRQSELERLAADCVRVLHALASPVSDEELARRRRAHLTKEQESLLLAWGYPYVLQCFRFHVSLTGSLQELPEETLGTLTAAAARHFHDLPVPRVDRLSIFIEPSPGDDFLLLEQIGFHP